MKNTTRLKLASAALALFAGSAHAQNFTVGADLNFLTLSHSEGQTIGFPMALAPEIWASYETAGGLDLGLRWFGLDSSTADATSRYGRIKMQTIDLTAAKPIGGSGFNANLFGGLRHAQYREYENGGVTFLDVPNAYGVLGGLEVNASLSDSLSLYGKGSTSLMFAPTYDDNGFARTNLTFNISEVEVGVQYNRQRANGGDFYLRLSALGKFWAGVSDNDTEDIAAVGAGIDIGMSF